MTKELFQINDILLEVNPSDIKVLDDNYVVEESYLRSTAVYANRSRYAATKIAITIPLEMSDTFLTSLDKVNYATLPNNFKLVCQLSNYPFCFIKSKRISTYVNVPSKSATGFMIFAVSEINLVSRAEASNILFLEMVLVFFNHTPFIRDFRFLKYFSLSETADISSPVQLKQLFRNYDRKLSEADLTQNLLSKVRQKESVGTLAECESWQTYFENIFFNIANNIKKEDFLNTIQELTGIFTTLRVAIATPIVGVVTPDTLFLEEEGRMEDNNTRYVYSMNTDARSSEVYERLLTSTEGQNFTAEQLSTNIRTPANSTKPLTPNEIAKANALNPTADPVYNAPPTNVPSFPVGRDAMQKIVSDAQQNENAEFLNNIKIYTINWADIDLDSIGASVQSFKLTKRNKLAINHIASFKHPIVQHLGKAPTEVTIQYTTNSANQYLHELGPTAFIKDKFNIIDLNRAQFPQMMAYNYLKIKTIPSFLAGSFKFLPNQMHTSASSSEQGIDNFVVTFVESDLEDILKTSELVNSGKNAYSTSAEFSHNVMIRLVRSLAKALEDPSKLTEAQKELYTKYYHMSLLLLNEVLQEYGTPSLIFETYSDKLFNKEKASLPERLLMSLARFLVDSEESISKENQAQLAAGGAIVGIAAASGVASAAAAGVSATLATTATTAAGAAALVATAGILAAVGFVALIAVAVAVVVGVVFAARAIFKRLGFIDANPANYKYAFKSGVVVPVNENAVGSFLRPIQDAAANTLGSGISATEAAELKKLRDTIHIPNLKDMENVLKNRLAIVTNKAPANLKNVTFRERVEVNQLIKQLMADIYFGATNGDSVSTGIVAAFAEDFGKLFSNSKSSFIGQAIPDLKLENISYKTAYVEESDTVIKSISPFFFIEGLSWVDKNIILNTFADVTQIDNSVQESLKGSAIDLINADPVGVKSGGIAGISEEGCIPVNSVTPQETIYADTLKTEEQLKATVEQNIAQTNGEDKAIATAGLSPAEQAAAAAADVSVYNATVLAEGSTSTVTKKKQGQFPKNLGEITVNHDSKFLLEAKAKHLKWNISDAEWLVLANGMAYSESYYDYTVQNLEKNHYFGKFQMGTMALVEAGLIRYAVRNDPAAIKYPGSYLGGMTLEKFLRSPEAPQIQSDAYALFTQKTYQYIVKDFKAENYDFNALPKPIQLALVAAGAFGHAHVFKLWKNGTATGDGSKKPVKNSLVYASMRNLQEELAKNPGNKGTDVVSDSGLLATIDGKFIRANSPATFIFENKAGVQTEYHLEGILDAGKADLFDLDKVSKAGYTLKSITDTLTSKLNKALSPPTFTNMRIEVKPNTFSNSGIPIARAFGVVPSLPGNKVTEASKYVLTLNIAPIDPEYLNTQGFNAAYRQGVEKLEKSLLVMNSPGMLALLKGDKTVTQGTPARVDKAPTLGAILDASKQSNKSANVDKGRKLTRFQAPILPLGDDRYVISSGYGFRPTSKNPQRQHDGIDIVLANGKDITGSKVISFVAGVVSKIKDTPDGYGKVVYVQHGPNFTTVYAHLSQILVKEGSQVLPETTVLGLAGNSGGSSGPHLHYEIKYIDPQSNKGNVKLINPYLVNNLPDLIGGKGGSIVPAAGASDSVAFTPPPKQNIAIVQNENSVYNEKLLVNAYVDELNETLGHGLDYAFPTIKVYITIGNEDQDYFLGSAGTNIQYYELKGIRDFRLNTNTDTNPIDTISMVVSDPNFLKTDEMTSLISRPNINYNAIGTDYETQFTNNRLKLRPGMKLHVRMGYKNDPDTLDIVFNGFVVATNNIHANAIQVIAESFGKELLTDVLGTTTPQRLGGGWNSSTGTIFADLMQVPGIYHFGKTFSFARMAFEFSLGDATDPESRSLLGTGVGVFNNPFSDGSGSPIINTNYLFGFKVFSSVIQRSRIYTNIYASDIEYVDDSFNTVMENLVSNWASLIKKVTYDFFAVKETPWDVMKQMTYRHPGTIVKPLWYQDRCTLFFGIKEQMYIARDLDASLMKLAARDVIEEENKGPLSLYAKKRTNRFKPAVGFHVISSELNLISNGIKLNGDYFTKVNVGYRDDNSDISSIQHWETAEMSLDDNLAPWEIRATELNLSGCDGRYMAFRYGTAFLISEAEKMYGGSIYIVGNPKMKSGDYAYLQDETRNLFGMIKIRECIHHYDERNGFVTEITPGQFVEPAEFVRSTLFLRLGLAARAFFQEKSPELLSAAYSSTSLQTALNYLTIQEQWAKLTRSRGNTFFLFNRNTPSFKNSTIDLAMNDGLLFGGYFLTGLFTNYMGYLAVKYALPRSLIRSPTTNAYVNIFKWVLKGADGAGTIGKLLGAQSRSLVEKFGKISRGNSGIFSRGAQYSWKLTRVAGRITLGSFSRVAISAMRSRVVGFAFSNPLGLMLFAITSLAISWASARIQEDQYTRQPALFYPLIQHGRPYVGGMTGALRNEYWDSLARERDITLTAIKRAATIINNKRVLSGESEIPFKNSLVNSNGDKRSATFKTNADGQVIRNIYENKTPLAAGQR